MPKNYNFREKRYSISQVALKVGVSVKTIQRLEKKGVVHPTRTLGNQRRFTDGEVLLLKKYFTKSSSLKKRDFVNAKPVSIYALAHEFGVHEATVRRWEKKGKLYKLGSKEGVDYYLKPSFEEINKKTKDIDNNSRIMPGYTEINAIINDGSRQVINNANNTFNYLVYAKFTILSIILFGIGFSLTFVWFYFS